jgi:hypothetical protein
MRNPRQNSSQLRIPSPTINPLTALTRSCVINPIRAFGHNRLPNMSSSKTTPGNRPGRFQACLALLVFLTQFPSTTHPQEPGTPNPLPTGVTPVWDLAKALHETTATREKICVNGLWQWQRRSGRFGIRQRGLLPAHAIDFRCPQPDQPETHLPPRFLRVHDRMLRR